MSEPKMDIRIMGAAIVGRADVDLMGSDFR
jgi:hypothetical protein